MFAPTAGPRVALAACDHLHPAPLTQVQPIRVKSTESSPLGVVPINHQLTRPPNWPGSAIPRAGVAMREKEKFTHVF